MTTRREFIQRIGAVGGFLAAYSVMREFGMLGPEVAYAGPPDLAPNSGAGTKVVILGGGLAGLCSAYELRKAGYDCTILEARERVGGRNWTMRRGSVLEMTDGSRQVCDFDEGLYFNAGPARIPSHHQVTLGYCREFGVELETQVNLNMSTRLQSDGVLGGRPVQMRQVMYDLRGQVSELLGKAVRGSALDAQLSAEDKERLLAYLRSYADLRPDGVYRGTVNAGFRQQPGAAGVEGTAYDPLPLHDLLDPRIWRGTTFADSVDMQTSMLQPVGGMDHIPMAFESRIPASVIHKGAEVRKIQRRGAGAAITWLDKASGQTQVTEADYAICTIPLKVLAGIDADFTPAYREAIRTTPYGDAVKVAFQSPRFWEHEDQIYGGLSFTDRETSVVWYPSGGFHRDQGVILGCYNWDDEATNFARRTISEQIEYSRASIDKMHPGKGGRLQKGVAIHWGKVPYNLGPWVGYSETETDPRYSLLNNPDGPYFFAGEHLSHVGAWQQGAFLSAHRAIGLIDARVRQGRVAAH